MIYYSPYKQIIRAFLRSVRVFIISLFSKRLLLMIIVALVVMLLHMNVHAESIYQDGYAYKQVKDEGYEEETDTYLFSYRIYTVNGLKEGTLHIPSTVYSSNKWFMYYFYSDDSVRIIVDPSSSSTRTLYYRAYNNGEYWFTYSKTNWDMGTYKYWIKSKNSDVFTDGNTYSGEYRSYTTLVSPQCILYTKNIVFEYVEYPSGNSFTSQDSAILENRILKTPSLRYYTGTGFRLYLNEFEPYDSTEYQDLNIDYSTIDTVNLYFSVYDLNNKTYTTQLHKVELQDYDEDGNLYVDILFSDLPYMNSLDGDYILFFGTYLTNTRAYNNSSFNFITRYDTLDYWRYTYYADSGAGILRAVYEDGTEKPYQDNTSTEEPSQQDTTTQAINDLNNSINNQTQQQHQDAQATQTIIEESTNAILSTDADDITMDDFGVQSPTIENEPDLSNVFDMLYNSFMQVYEDDIYRIQFGLPHSEKVFNFDIPADALRSKLPNELVVLISVFWWVVLGGFVITFIVKIIHQIVTYSNGSVDGKSSGGFLSELTMTPTEFVLFNILH